MTTRRASQTERAPSRRRRQPELYDELGNPVRLPLRISGDCPRCGQGLVLRDGAPWEQGCLECSAGCGFTEPRDEIIARLMEKILRLRSRLAELGGGLL